jgi:hypothetical protein
MEEIWSEQQPMWSGTLWPSMGLVETHIIRRACSGFGPQTRKLPLAGW